MARNLEVRIIGDSRSFERSMSTAARSALSFGRIVKTAIAFDLVHRGIDMVASGLRSGWDEWKNQAQVAAQTGAVLKSTGGIAGVTAKHVDELASSLLRKTGIDDEAIKSSENLLLGFTKIRNEVGAGNDVFDRAAKIVQDFSVRTGRNATSASIAFGKALNDPLKGMSALSRVGVQFTADQKKQIEALVKSGDALGAQKMILGELETRYKGAAEAAGSTMPGKLNIFKESLRNLEGQMIQGLIPSLMKLVDWTNQHWPQIEAGFRTASAGIKFASENVIGPALQKIIPAGQAAVEWTKAHWPEISGVATSVGEKVLASARTHWPQISAAITQAMDNVRDIITGVVAIAQAIWARFGSAIKTIADRDFHAVVAVVKDVLAIIQSTFALFADLLHGRWGKAWDDVKSIASHAISGTLTLVRTAVANFLTAAGAIGKAIWSGIKEGVGDLAAKVGHLLSELGSIIKGWAGSAYAYAFKIGSNIVNGILDGIGDLAGKVGGKIASGLKGAVSFAGGLLRGSGDFMFTIHAIGKPLAQGVIEGWIIGSAALPGKMGETLRNAIEKGRQTVEAARSTLSMAFSGLASDALSALDAKFAAFKTPTEKLLDRLVAQRDAQDFKQRMKDAQQAYRDAVAEFAAFSADPTQGGTLDAAAQADKQKQLGQATIDAQKNIADLTFEQRRAHLEKVAAEERRQQDARDTVERNNFTAALAALGEHLSKKGATAAKATDAVLDLLGKYGVNFAQVGRDMGIAWIGAFKQAIEEAAGGAGALSGTIADVAAGIKIPEKAKRAMGGSVNAGMAYLVGERGPELFVPRGNGAVLANGGFGGGATYNVYLPNYLGDKHEVVETIRTELIRIDQRNGR